MSIFGDRIICRPATTPGYAKEETDLYFQVYLKEFPEKEIGYVCFQNLDFKRRRCSIAYRIYEGNRRKGYCKEAVDTACSFIFENTPINKIIGECKKTNVGSIKVLEGNGFSKEKENKRSMFVYSLYKKTL